MLTGQTELDLPDTRKRITDTNFVDVYPFIWKDFSKNGYVTAFLEDTPEIGTYSYRLNGFKEPPTDHYMRPYYLAAKPIFSDSPTFCFGAIPRHKIMINHIKHVSALHWLFIFPCCFDTLITKFCSLFYQIYQISLSQICIHLSIICIILCSLTNLIYF